jgi:hypothetical protein
MDQGEGKEVLVSASGRVYESDPKTERIRRKAENYGYSNKLTRGKRVEIKRRIARELKVPTSYVRNALAIAIKPHQVRIGKNKTPIARIILLEERVAKLEKWLDTDRG